MNISSNQKLQIGNLDDRSTNLTILRPHYEMPEIDVIDEWNIVMDSLLKDLRTVNGGE